jgi:hypothetical protein
LGIQVKAQEPKDNNKIKNKRGGVNSMRGCCGNKIKKKMIDLILNMI